MKLDSPGFVLTRYHASLLLEIKKELGDDLASSVRYCLKPELVSAVLILPRSWGLIGQVAVLDIFVMNHWSWYWLCSCQIYFPTMFGLLNCFSNSQAIDSNQIASSSSSDITIQRIPTIYTHTSSRPGDDSAVEATFSAISQNMMIEFRLVDPFAKGCIYVAVISSDVVMMALDWSSVCYYSGKVELCLLSIFRRLRRYTPNGSSSSTANTTFKIPQYINIAMKILSITTWLIRKNWSAIQ